MSLVHGKARSKLARIVFPEGDAEKIQHAAQILREEGLCEPILLGPVQRIRASIEERRLDGLEGVQVILPEESADYDRYVSRFWELRARKGMTFAEARRQVRARNYYASVMVERGDADGMVTGLTVGYPDGIRAPLEVIGTRKGRRAAGVYIVVTKDDFKFFADTTVNIDPSPQALADIAVATADLARFFDVTPRVAMLSYSSFGAAKGESPAKVRKATELVRQMRPDLEIDGEIQVDIATDTELRVPEFPFSTLKEDANVFVFPNLDSANISYQLLEAMGGAEVIGPVLLGMNLPVNVLQMGTSVQSIVNLAAITAMRAQGDQFIF
jgi:malate dehydrogenase (oxaloacetate-decarboxylating)(NADP+)